MRPPAGGLNGRREEQQRSPGRWPSVPEWAPVWGIRECKRRQGRGGVAREGRGRDVPDGPFFLVWVYLSFMYLVLPFMPSITFCAYFSLNACILGKSNGRSAYFKFIHLSKPT